MHESLYSDPFATKAVEYLLVLAFLPALVVFWKFLNRTAQPAVAVARAGLPAATRSRWFAIPVDRFYHTGHAWARPAGGDVLTVGMDDFAQKLVGKPARVTLPAVGDRVQQGAPGCTLQVDGRSVEVLSPVDGEVVAVNRAVLESPELLNEQPYGEGWLMKVRASRMKPDLKTLLSGDSVRAWMETVENTLRKRMCGEAGLVLQDGGFPVSGIARGISPEKWDEVAREFLLTG